VTKTAHQQHDILAGESRIISFDCRGVLDAGETLTGTPTVAEVGTADLSFSSESVSTAVLTINGVSVGMGLAAQCLVNASGAEEGLYTLVITCSTSAGQTIKAYAKLMCVG